MHTQFVCFVGLFHIVNWNSWFLGHSSMDQQVSLHQGSVLSPLLFAAVMDVVSNESLRYGDDTVQ